MTLAILRNKGATKHRVVKKMKMRIISKTKIERMRGINNRELRIKEKRYGQSKHNKNSEKKRVIVKPKSKQAKWSY